MTHHFDLREHIFDDSETKIKIWKAPNGQF